LHPIPAQSGSLTGNGRIPCWTIHGELHPAIRAHIPSSHRSLRTSLVPNLENIGGLRERRSTGYLFPLPRIPNDGGGIGEDGILGGRSRTDVVRVTVCGAGCDYGKMGRCDAARSKASAEVVWVRKSRRGTQWRKYIVGQHGEYHEKGARQIRREGNML